MKCKRKSITFQKIFKLTCALLILLSKTNFFLEFLTLQTHFEKWMPTFNSDMVDMNIALLNKFVRLIFVEGLLNVYKNGLKITDHLTIFDWQWLSNNGQWEYLSTLGETVGLGHPITNKCRLKWLFKHIC